MPDGEGIDDAGELPAQAQPPTDANLNETLQRLPAEQREVVEEYIRFHRGPLPPASELAAYDAVLPGLAREIVDAAREERNHRHTMNDKIVEHEYRLNWGGIAAAFAALIAMLAVVAYMVHRGAAKEAAALGSVIIVGVVVALTFHNRNSAKKPDPAPAKTIE